MENENTLNEILESVAIHKKMVELRDLAKRKFESAVSCSINDKIDEFDPNTCNQHVIEIYKAYRICRILTILIERGKKDDANNDVDRIYFDLGCQL